MLNFTVSEVAGQSKDIAWLQDAVFALQRNQQQIFRELDALEAKVGINPNPTTKSTLSEILIKRAIRK